MKFSSFSSVLIFHCMSTQMVPRANNDPDTNKQKSSINAQFYSLVVSRRGRLVKALDQKYIGIYPHRFESCQRLQILLDTGDLFLICLYFGCCICNSVCNCKKEVYLQNVIIKIYWGLPRTASNPVDVSKCLVVQVKTKKNIRSSMFSLLKLQV